jgi:hypothetical protein
MNIAYQIVFDISETMTNLDIVSLRSDVILSKLQASIGIATFLVPHKTSAVTAEKLSGIHSMGSVIVFVCKSTHAFFCFY